MYLFFDTETTGIPQNYQASLEDLDNWPRLVQIAWLTFNENKEKISGHAHIIKPEGFIIPEEAARVHRIDTEKAEREGEDLSEILKKFARDVKGARYLVAHNMNFDEKIVGAEFLRKGIEHDFFDTERICTMEKATPYCRIPGNYNEYKWPRLSELHIKLFGKDFKDAHDALVDVEACARCFFEMRQRGLI